MSWDAIDASSGEVGGLWLMEFYLMIKSYQHIPAAHRLGKRKDVKKTPESTRQQDNVFSFLISYYIHSHSTCLFWLQQKAHHPNWLNYPVLLFQPQYSRNKGKATVAATSRVYDAFNILLGVLTAIWRKHPSQPFEFAIQPKHHTVKQLDNTLTNRLTMKSSHFEILDSLRLCEIFDPQNDSKWHRATLCAKAEPGTNSLHVIRPRIDSSKGCTNVFSPKWTRWHKTW